MTGTPRQSPVDLPTATGVARHLSTPARPAPYNSAMRRAHGATPPGGSPLMGTTGLPSPVDTFMSGRYMPDFPQQPPPAGVSSALFGGHVTSLDSPPRSVSSLTATSHHQYPANAPSATADTIEAQFPSASYAAQPTSYLPARTTVTSQNIAGVNLSSRDIEKLISKNNLEPHRNKLMDFMQVRYTSVSRHIVY